MYDVLEYLAGGMTEEQILTDFPDLTRDDIRAALARLVTILSSEFPGSVHVRDVGLRAAEGR